MIESFSSEKNDLTTSKDIIQQFGFQLRYILDSLH